MYHLYIIYSESIDQYYTGHSKNLQDRLTRHNEGKSLATKRGVPWELKFSLAFDTRSEAIRSEKWIKSMKSRDVVEEVIKGEIELKNILNG